MARKHFNVFANIISNLNVHGQKDGEHLISKAQLIGRLSDYFSRINDRFSEEKFLDACYKNQE